MTSAYEGQRHDLFDFPEVEGLEEFGLVPPVPDGFEAADASTAPATASDSVTAPVPAPTAAAAPATEPPSAPQPAPEAEDDDAFVMAPARPNPTVPADVTDLDEDLFQFNEIFSLEEDPYFNGTLSLDGTPTNPVFLDDSSAADTTQATVEDPALDPAVDTAPVQPEVRPAQQATDSDALPTVESTPSAAAPAPQPKQQATSEPTLPESIAPAAQPAAPLMAETSGTPGASAATIPALPPAGGTRATLDRGPRILLPEDVPYSATGERQRTVWALIACFLLVNTGIFVLAHQASSNFQNTMSAATGLLAEALTRQNDAPTHAAAPVAVTYVEHTVDPQPTERDAAEPRVDPSGYGSPHEFAVANAKALMTEGRFEDARRQLNYVLANKARVPLAPSLREEIDYLIPLTYYEQGNATAPEDDR